MSKETLKEVENYTSCLKLTAATDHKNYGYMNFREFVQFGFELYHDAFCYGKAIQFNCSSCMDIEYYNIRHETGNYTSVLVSDEPVCMF